MNPQETITAGVLTPEDMNHWEQVVLGSAHGHLMARCGYFLYHADRFEDHSLLFRRGNRVLAVLPANRVGETLWSHQGVSFGGLIMSRRCRFDDVREIFSALEERMRADGLRRLLYRPAPHPYQRSPREDDLYCLRNAGARIVDTKLHAMLVCGKPEDIASNRAWQRDLNLARAAGVQVAPGENVEDFWPHVVRLLREKHDQSPIHSREEILLLRSRFPRQIRLLEARSPEGVFLAGILYMISERTLNLMYIGETEEGRAVSAGRLVYDSLMHDPTFEGYWMDMGQWTDTESREESESLLHFKESAGARLIQRHTWELEVP